MQRIVGGRFKSAGSGSFVMRHAGQIIFSHSLPLREDEMRMRRHDAHGKGERGAGKNGRQNDVVWLCAQRALASSLISRAPETNRTLTDASVDLTGPIVLAGRVWPARAETRLRSPFIAAARHEQASQAKHKERAAPAWRCGSNGKRICVSEAFVLPKVRFSDCKPLEKLAWT